MVINPRDMHFLNTRLSKKQKLLSRVQQGRKSSSNLFMRTLLSLEDLKRINGGLDLLELLVGGIDGLGVRVLELEMVMGKVWMGGLRIKGGGGEGIN